jgi:hypothetical protein
MRGLRSIQVVITASMLIAGCATDSSDRAVQPGGSSQQDLADDAHHYRAQAYVLWDMAQRRQAEAEVLSQKLGPDHEDVQRKLKLAQELQKAATEADRKARATKRQVPHNVVQ